MADLSDIQRSETVRIVGGDEAYAADVILEDGQKKLRAKADVSVDSLYGFDPIPDTWFYIGNENDDGGAGNAGDTIRVRIAAGSIPSEYPAIDLTYILTALDQSNNDDDYTATQVAAFLNADVTFSALWRAQKVTGSGCVYITSKKPGSQYERANINDFLVTATGTTVVTAAWTNIIRRKKITSLARDPADPRQGVLGIQGSVVQTEGDVTNRFQTVFSELRVNGSVTPVDFQVSAHATEVRFITSVTLSGRANGIKFGQFLANAALTNGILVSFKSNDFMSQLESIKTTDDILDYLAEDPDNFTLFIQSGGDKFTAVLEFASPLELRPQGEFASNDYLKISIRDNLTAGIQQLRATVNGFNREY